MQVLERVVPARAPHPAEAAPETALAQFVIANHRAQPRPVARAQFSETLRRACPRRRIAHAHEGGIARVIAIGDHHVRLAAAREKFLEPVIVREGIALPDEMMKRPQQQSRGGIRDARQAISAARLLGVTRVMDVADEQQSVGRHDWVAAATARGGGGELNIIGRVHSIANASASGASQRCCG